MPSAERDVSFNRSRKGSNENQHNYINKQKIKYKMKEILVFVTTLRADNLCLLK